jgi:hypothetical protein
MKATAQPSEEVFSRDRDSSSGIRGSRRTPLLCASAKSGEPFKMLEASKIRRLCKELHPAPLKVWLYHYARSGRDDSSFPRLETIASDTDQNVQTVKLARKWLRDNGWLITTGQMRVGGQFSVPIERAEFPEPSPRVDFPPTVPAPPRVEKPAAVNPPVEVDSDFSEVQSPPNPPLARGAAQIAIIQLGREVIEVTLHDKQGKSRLRRFWTRRRAESYIGAQAFEVADRLKSLGFDAQIRAPRNDLAVRNPEVLAAHAAKAGSCA